jgi:hypothetical protein
VRRRRAASTTWQRAQGRELATLGLRRMRVRLHRGRVRASREHEPRRAGIWPRRAAELDHRSDRATASGSRAGHRSCRVAALGNRAGRGSLVSYGRPDDRCSAKGRGETNVGDRGSHRSSSILGWSDTQGERACSSGRVGTAIDVGMERGSQWR